MRYPIISQENAKKVLDARHQGDDVDCSELIQWKGEGEDFNKDVVDNIYKLLIDLKEKYPETLKNKDPNGGKFEAEACVLIHENLAGNNDVYSDLDFWTFLSVVEFPDIVEWRHGVDGHHANIANYGIGNRTENLVYRMWLRAELVALPAAEGKYDLAKRGDIDLWRSHMLRQNYANCRKLARALVRFQYPDANPQKPTLKIEKIRELAKRLRRIYANVVFSFLDEARIASLIEKESKSLG